MQQVNIDGPEEFLNNENEEQNLLKSTSDTFKLEKVWTSLRILRESLWLRNTSLVYKLENVRSQLNDANAEIAALTAKVEEQNQEMKGLLTGVSETADRD